MSDIAISVSNVSKTFKIPHEKVTSLRGAAVGVFKRKSGYEEFKALDDVSFEVKKGEFFGIIGRNGSGKSTLLKILAGIYQPDKGKVKINGRISPFLELGIGFNPELSGRDNVYLNATVLGLSKKEIDEKFDSIVKFSELERFIDQKLKNYSSGMQVRLAFSVSIHANRDILLMDEVLAVGDSNFQSKCIREFTKYKELGRTVIIVTHDISVVQRYCDRAMLIRNGRVEKIGASECVCDLYINQNMKDADNVSRNGEITKKTDERKVDLVDGNNNSVAEVTKIEFFDKEGKASTAFKNGDDISIKIFFKINEPRSIINFGLSLFSADKNYIFGTNTIFDKVDTKNFIGRGFVQIDLKNVSLSENHYYVRVVIAGDNFKSLYSAIAESSSFMMFSNKKFEGLFCMDHLWR